MQPLEIIVAPFSVYQAPVGEAFPLIDAAPAGGWTLIGSAGDRNYDEAGVTVNHSQAFEKFRPLGSTGPRKVARTEEDLMISFTLWDNLLEQYAIALNGNAVATTAAASGVAGFKAMQTYRGLTVNTLALLVRGNVSPEGDGFNTQYEVPICYQSASPAPVYSKGAPAALALEFTTIEDPNAATVEERFGRLVVQHQAPLP